MSLNLTTPLPDDWNDAAFAEAHRRLTADPKSLTDSDLVLFLTAHGAAFAQTAATARATGTPPGREQVQFLKQSASKPATMGMVSAAVDLVLDAFRTLRVSKRLLTIEARLAALDARALPHYEGIFESGKTYPAGSLTTRGGGLWLAVEATDRTPGAAVSGWKLIVKSGGA